MADESYYLSVQDAYFHWHDLRRSFATIMENNSIHLKELAEVIGHHSSDFTMNTYVEKKQPVFEGMREYLDILERATKGEETSRTSPAGLSIVEYPVDPLKFTHLIEQARAPDRHSGPVVGRQKKTLPPMGKCRIIIQIDICTESGKNVILDLYP